MTTRATISSMPRLRSMRDGKFLAVKIHSFGNLGAYVSFRGAMPPVVNIGTVCWRSTQRRQLICGEFPAC